MICDLVERWNGYPFGPAWRRAFEFIASLGPGAEDGRYPIDGDGLYAIVMSYETRSLETAALEAHRRYVDIQIVLSGAEVMEWLPVSALAVKTPYDAAKDAEFYHRPDSVPVRLQARPGLFAAFFPQDAHLTQLVAANAPARVKKAVVKIRADLL